MVDICIVFMGFTNFGGRICHFIMEKMGVLIYWRHPGQTLHCKGDDIYIYNKMNII